MLQHQKRRGRSLNLVDAYQHGAPGNEEFDGNGDQEYNDEQAESSTISQRYILLGFSPPSRPLKSTH